MKKLANLKGVKALSKTQQKSINGGVFACGWGKDCPDGWWCPIDYRRYINRACIPVI